MGTEISESTTMGVPATATQISSNMSTTTLTPNGSLQEGALDVHDHELLVNVTREYPFDYATVMFGYIMPFVLVLTLVTNTLVVMVLAQRHMRTPTNIVLFTMAIVDLMTLLSPSPWYFYIYTLGYHDKFLYPPIACYIHHIMTDVVPVFFHTSSIWLALLLASQRYIYVCHPTLASTWCTVPRVKKAIIIILVVAFLHQLTRFFDVKFVPVQVILDHVQYMACKYETANWVISFDVGTYFTLYYIFRILFVFIIPCNALITLNCLLFRALKRAENKRTELLKTKFKLMGGNHCSMGAIENSKRSSFMGHPQRLANTEATSGLMLAMDRQQSISRVSNQLQFEKRNSMHSTRLIDASKTMTNTGNLTGAGGQSKCGNRQLRRLSMISLHFRRGLRSAHRESQAMAPTITPVGVATNTKRESGENKNELEASSGANQSPLPKVSSSQNQTSDTKMSTCLSQESNSRKPDKGASSRANGRGKSLFGGQSNDSCSMTTSQSRQENRQQQQQPQQQRSKRSSSSSGRVPFVLNSNVEQMDDDDYDELTCADCAACRCHCSTNAANEDATSGNDRADHQAASQCSSLIGGATTTNEDNSSCNGTQNVSSSMYVIHDGTLDTVEVASMREDGIEDEELEGVYVDQDAREPQQQQQQQQTKANEEGSTISHNNTANFKSINSSQATPKEDSNEQQPMRRASSQKQSGKSESSGCRLVCACTGNNQFRHESDSLSVGGHRIEKREAIVCRECICVSSNNNCPPASRSNQRTISNSRLPMRDPKCTVASCSSLDPCVSCAACKKNARQRHKLSLKCKGEALACGRHRRKSGNLPACQSDYSVNDNSTCKGQARLVDEPKECNSREQNKMVAAVAAAAAPTNISNIISSAASPQVPPTTAITLDSATADTNANSTGSSLQVAHKQPGASQQTLSAFVRQNSQMGASSSASSAFGPIPVRVKSPSFANTSGRGSRATLLGAGTNQGLLSVAGATSSSAVTASGSHSGASIRTMDSNRTTLMLIVVVTVFLMVEVPVAIVTIIHVVLNTFDVFRDFDLWTSLSYIKMFTNFFIMISYSVNFTIYCSMSKKFRETFRDLFMCGRRAKRKQANKLLYQQHQHQQQQQQPSHYQPHLFNTNTNTNTVNNNYISQVQSDQNNFNSNNNNNNNNINLDTTLVHNSKTNSGTIIQQEEIQGTISISNHRNNDSNDKNKANNSLGGLGGSTGNNMTESNNQTIGSLTGSAFGRANSQQLKCQL